MHTFAKHMLILLALIMFFIHRKSKPGIIGFDFRSDEQSVLQASDNCAKPPETQFHTKTRSQFRINELRPC